MAAEKKVPAWRRVLPMVVWLYTLPPVGIWKLWRDPELSSSARWRILVYTFVIPLLLYLAIGFWSMNKTMERLLP